MKTTKFRNAVMTLGAVAIATLTAGCFSGGGPGYSDGYSSSYSSYGSSRAYSNYGGRYSEAPRVEARPETLHASVDRDKISLRDSESVDRTERN
jgi:hypothetical protein